MARAKLGDVTDKTLFITFSCQHKLPLFRDDYLYEMMVKQLARLKSLSLADLLAYVVMPNHVHVIVTSHVSDVKSILYSLKKPISQKALPYLKRHYPEDFGKTVVQVGRKAGHRFWLWGGGYIRAIRSHDEIRNEIKYIHRNPVRWNLSKKPEGWRWSSFQYYLTGEPDPIPVDRPDWI